MKTAGKYRILTFAAGIATACLIVFCQLFYFQAATYCQEKAETQQQKEKEFPIKEAEKTHSEAYISIPSNTIASVSNIQINEGLSFVVGILFEQREDTPTAASPAVSNRLFQTLFRFIIATNAP